MAETENKISGPDIAYRILKESKTEIYFRDLLTAVLAEKKVPTYMMTPAMAELHTQINLDSRFAFKGKGLWGLTEWIPVTRVAGRSDDNSSTVLEEVVEFRRTKLQEVQQPDEIDAGFRGDNDEPAQNE